MVVVRGQTSQTADPLFDSPRLVALSFASRQQQNRLRGMRFIAENLKKLFGRHDASTWMLAKELGNLSGHCSDSPHGLKEGSTPPKRASLSQVK